jgi:predicted aminopeptidase
MTLDEFLEKMAAGGPVPLSAEEWVALSSSLPEVERHNTQLAGDLIIVRAGEKHIAVESPSRDARVARLLGSAQEARAFVAKRLEEYERMWDGCGVKVEYYEP